MKVDGWTDGRKFVRRGLVTNIDGAFKSFYDLQTVVQTNNILYLLIDFWSQSFIDFQLRQKNFFVHRTRTSECDVISYDSSLMTRHCLAERHEYGRHWSFRLQSPTKHHQIEYLFEQILGWPNSDERGLLNSYYMVRQYIHLYNHAQKNHMIIQTKNLK